MALASYTGLVKFESLKKPYGEYGNYMVALSLDDDSFEKLKKANYSNPIGEENTVFFARSGKPQFEDDEYFGPVKIYEGVEGNYKETNLIPGVGSTVTVRVEHYVSKAGPRKGKVVTKLRHVLINDYVEGDWDDRLF